jgi:hypothetical protein
MELDDLKSIWKKKQSYPAKQADEIAAMIKGSSNSIVAKLKRSVWFELTITIVFGLIMLYFSFTLRSGAMKWSIVSLLLLLLAYLVYYVKKIQLLNHFDPSQQNIRENLENLINDLKAYLQFYRSSYLIFYPVYFVLGILFAAIERGFDNFLHRLTEPEMILRLLFATAVIMTTALLFTNWYLKKLYGNHLVKLQDLLRDLKDSATQEG